MDNLEKQLNALIENPQMMQQIMTMAQSFNAAQTTQDSQQTQDENLSAPDLQTIQKITSIAGKTNIDPNQKNLLHALAPYLSNNRINKLEKAMRAAKLARFASTMISR